MKQSFNDLSLYCWHWQRELKILYQNCQVQDCQWNFRKIQQFLLARGKNSNALNKKTNFHLFVIILNLRRDSLFPPPGNIFLIFTFSIFSFIIISSINASSLHYWIIPPFSPFELRRITLFSYLESFHFHHYKTLPFPPPQSKLN